MDNTEIDEDTADVVMSFVLLVDSSERVDQQSVRIPSTETAEEDVSDKIVEQVSRAALNACFASKPKVHGCLGYCNLRDHHENVSTS